MKHSVLFLDCDGVIVLSEEFNFLCWNKALYQLHRVFVLNDCDFRCLLGISLNQIYSFFEGRLNRSFSSEERQELLQAKNHYYFEEAKNYLKKVDGIDDLILQAKKMGWLIVVVSNSVSQKLDCSLDAIGMKDLFDYRFSGDHGGLKEYQTALQKLKLFPSQVVVVEDTATGILAAHKAGIVATVGITTYEPRTHFFDSAPSLIVDHLAEIDLTRWSTF